MCGCCHECISPSSIPRTPHRGAGGLSIQAAGTNVGVVTDLDGKFSLTMPKGKTVLRVSYVGMETVEVVGKRNMKIVLKHDETGLDEVLVVAYGKTTKQAFTGSATQIGGEAIAVKNTSEITKALQGEVAGVQVFNTSGQPGSNATIYINGMGTPNSSNTPLYVVDGIPFGADLSAINPNDMESMTVLKGPTATALYGARAANGVILITTKKGERGTVKIEGEFKYGANARWIPQYETIGSPERFTELTWESLKNGFMQGHGFAEDRAKMYASHYLFDTGAYGIAANYNMWNAAGDELIDPETGRFYEGITRKYSPESWKDNIFSTGQKIEGNVNISGGTSRMTFFTSLGFLKDEGYYIGSDFQRFNVRNNVTADVTSWLRTSLNLSYANMVSNQPGQSDDQSNNGFQFVNAMPALFPVFEHDADGNLVEDPVVGGYRYDYGMNYGYGRGYGAGINPAGALQLDKDKSKTNQLRGNLSVDARFLKDFKFTVNVGMDYLNTTNDILTNPYYGDAEGVGRIEKYQLNYMNVTSNEILSYAKTFDKHSFDAFIAHEATWSENKYTDGQMSDIIRGNNLEWSNAIIMSYMSSDKYRTALESYFGQVNYNYDNRYFANAAIRRDGSSRFADGNRWGTFGSLGFGWVITNEQFMKNISWLKYLKFKADWGLLGNQSILTVSSAINSYPYLDLFSISNNNDYASIRFAYKGNKDLTWEKTNSFNFGLEFNVANLVEGEFRYFNNTTRDMLYMKQVAPSLGFASYPVNDGKVRNSGIEFNLKWHAIKTNDMKLDVRLNGTSYSNKIIAMPHDDTTGLPKPYEIQGGYAWAEGHSLYDYYVREWAGVDPDNGAALYNQYYNVKADGTRDIITDMESYASKNTIEKLEVEKTSDYNSATRKFVGASAVPDLTGGFGFDFYYKGLEVSTTFSYGIGGKAYDNVYAALMGDNGPGQNNWSVDIENRWQNPGDITDVPVLTAGFSDYASFANATSTRFLTSRSFLSLNNARIGYTLPKEWFKNVGINKLSVYVTGENLFVATARKGFVSMASITGASGRSQYLPVSTVMGGVKIEF